MLNPQNYELSFYSVPVALVSTLILATGIFVFAQNRTRLSNISFFLFCLSLNLWLYGRALMYSSKEAEHALWIAKYFAFFGVAHISPLVYAFSVFWLELYKKQKKYLIAAFVAAPIFYLICITTPYGMPNVQKYFWGYYPVYGIVNKIFLGFFYGYFLAAFYNFFKALSREVHPIRKKQIQVIFVAFLISLTASLDYLPKVIRLPLYPIGYISVLLWTLIVGFAIVRYRTLDIQTVIHKTMLWFFTSTILGAPLVIIYYFSHDWLLRLHPIAFISFVAMTFFLFALYVRHVQPHIDHLFQRRQADLNRELENFSDQLVHLIDLDGVSQHILATVNRLFYASNLTLLVLRKPHSFQVFKVGTTDGDRYYDMDERLLHWLEFNDKVVVAENLFMDPRLGEIAEPGNQYFREMNAKICVPMVANGKLIALLNLGEKANLQPYRHAEMIFLADLRRSSGIALSNSLQLMAIQENLQRWNEELEKKVEERTEQLKLTQAQLVQAEKMATIGTLAGGVAHEINNPLTAVLTNAQILKMTANSEDLESIDLIEAGAKRCQVIIKSLLKYSRKSQAEIELVETQLNDVVKSAYNFLDYQMKQENVLVTIDYGEIAPILAIANELEQVITNLIVNARDATKKQQARPAEINIKTFQEGEEVLLVVADNGEGMPREVMNKIFDPFFTTKDVGGGTGLGLAVSHSIIQKHKGNIEVTSKQGEGTTFTITIPAVSKVSS